MWVRCLAFNVCVIRIAIVLNCPVCIIMKDGMHAKTYGVVSLSPGYASDTIVACVSFSLALSLSPCVCVCVSYVCQAKPVLLGWQ